MRGKRITLQQEESVAVLVLCSSITSADASENSTIYVDLGSYCKRKNFGCEDNWQEPRLI